MSMVERIKLFRLIPQICAEDNVLPERIEDFIRLHILLSENIPQSIIKDELEKVKEFFNHESRDAILFHLRFYIRHLNLLTLQERIAITTYLLDVLSSGSEATLSRLKLVDPTTIGKYIDADEQQDLLMQSVTHRYYSSHYDYDATFFSVLENILIGLSYDFRGKLTDYFQKLSSEKSQIWVEAINAFMPF